MSGVQTLFRRGAISLEDNYGEIQLYINDEYFIDVREFASLLSYLKSEEDPRSPYGAAFEAVTLLV